MRPFPALRDVASARTSTCVHGKVLLLLAALLTAPSTAAQAPDRRRHQGPCSEASFPTIAVSPCLGAGVLTAGPRGSAAESPAVLVATLSTLEKQARFGEILEHITPDQREIYLFITWFGAFQDALGGGPEVAEGYRALVARHGLDEDWLSKDVSGRDRLRRVAAGALRGVDLAELLADFARFRVQHGRSGVAFGFTGKLRELHVEEDWAFARIGRSEFQMVRRDEGWSWWPFKDLER